MKIVSIKKFIRSITIVLLIIVGLSLIISKSSYSRGEKQYKTIYQKEIRFGVLQKAIKIQMNITREKI